MAFVVEDGTGVANANSLCAVAFADAYFTDRGIIAWTGVTGVKQSALIRATDYIETRFGQKFQGELAAEDQELSWPRANVGADAIVPSSIQKAVAEYALRALTTTLAPDPVVSDTGRIVKSTSSKLGPIEESVTYVDGASVAQFKPYPAADALIRPWLRYANGLVRA